MDSKTYSTNSCYQCSLCVGDCPVFSVYREEPLSPKARALGTSLENASDLLWECKVCGLCQKVCPPEIPHIQEILDSRSKLIKIHKVSEEYETLTKNLQQNGNPFGVEETSFGGKEGKVLLWTGCTARNGAHEIIDSAIKFLEKVGISTAILDKEGCCGALEYFMGNTKSALEKIKKLYPIFSDFDEIITLCSKCHIGFKELFPKIIPARPKKSGKLVPKVSHLLETVYAKNKLFKFEPSSFFQFSCRFLNFSEEKVMLESMKFVKKYGFETNINSIGQALCCGGECYNGTLTDLAKWRIPQILKIFEGKDIVVSCPDCYINFKKHSKKNVGFVSDFCVSI